MKKILENSTLGFMSLFPIFSLVWFHSHITTLVIVLGVTIIFVSTLVIYKEARGKLKYLFLYYLLVLIYLYINYKHSFTFKSLVPGNFDYNIFKEGLTVLKLVMPVTFFYALYYQKIEYKKYIVVVKIWVLFITLVIIGTNLLGVSLGTYKSGMITKNILEWNSSNYYQETASKGYFMYANQIALWMFIMFILMLYEFLVNNKNIIYITLLFIAMLMLGTRISSLGCLLGIIVVGVIYLIYVFLHKEEFFGRVLYLGVLILVWFIVIPISPYKNRDLELNMASSGYLLVGEDSSMVAYVYDNYNPDYLPRVFFEIYYPINYDSLFWYQYVKNTSINEMNYRAIEESIIKRVVEINNNKYDVWFGISNSRIQNIVNIERDFVLHYYAFGIVGSLLLLGIFIILFGYLGYMFFKYQTFYIFVMSLALCLFVVSAYLTGNIVNSVNIMLPFVFLVSGIFGRKPI